MANLISHISRGASFSINNSWISVLYSTLLLSGSEIASSDWEKEFLIWLAEHDQYTVGLGLVGIDFDDIRWNKEDFEEQRDFITKIADKVINERMWEKLDYQTQEATLIDFLNKWKNIFLAAEISDVKHIHDYHWYVKPSKDDFNRRCLIHNVYLNKLHESDHKCCLICNDL